MIRVAFVCERLQPRGAERILTHLVTHLDRSRIEPVVVLFERGDAFEGELPPGTRVVTLPPGKGAPLRPDLLNGWSERVGAHLPMNGALVPALEALRPDLIVSLTSRCNLRLALEAERLPAPLVIGEMSLPRRIVEAQYPPELQEPIWEALGAAYRAPRRIVAVADVVARRLTEDLGVEEARLRVIRPGVNLGHTAVLASGRAAHPWFGAGVPVWISVGALVPAKNIGLTLEALARRPEARLIVVGEGPRRAELDYAARRLGVRDRVDFAGFVPNALAWMARADVLVQSSHFEGTPTVVIEAMACGTPVVATAVGGTPEIIDTGRTGILVPAGDPEALAAALRRVTSDRVLRERLRSEGRRAAAAFDVRAMARRYEELFASAA